MFSSPFSDLLRTNYAPNPKETEHIVNLLKKPQQHLVELNSQIERLETDLLALKAKRDALRDDIEGHRALLTPFRRLPEDILRGIFVSCLEEYPVRSTKDAPLLLTTVCRLWRQIALETPRLWSSIHIYIPQFSTGFLGPHPMRPQDATLAEQRLAGIERWLDKSGSVPISFSLSFSGMAPLMGGPNGEAAFPEDQLDVWNSFMDAFLRYRSRLRSARITSVHPFILATMKSLKPEDFPKLESLTVTIFRGISDSASATHLKYIEPVLRAPSLHRLNLDVSTIHYNVLNLPMRWDQVTELSLQQSLYENQFWSPIQMLMLLTRMTATIRSFSFAAVMLEVEDDYSRELGRSVLHLPVLKVLSVNLRKLNGIQPDGRPTGVTFEDLRRLFDFLSCPSLEDLTVMSNSTLVDSSAASPLERFLQQSECSLRIFNTDVALPRDVFTSTLRLMPSLTTITNRNTNLYQVFMMSDAERLTRNALLDILADSALSDDPVCPSLQHLELRSSDKSVADTVIRLIENRLMLGVFKSLKVQFNGYTDETYRTQVAGLREKGIDVRWLFQGSFNNDKPIDHPDEGIEGRVSPWSQRRYPLSIGPTEY